MRINEKVKKRRFELGLTESDISNNVGLSRSEYSDIELHEDELCTVTDICRFKKICEVLGFDLLELLEQKCAFCEEGASFVEEFSLSRNELIASRRRKMGISREELGERVGFYEAEIENLEKNPEHLETWPVDFIKDLAAIIDVPVQILLNMKCKRCRK